MFVVFLVFIIRLVLFEQVKRGWDLFIEVKNNLMFKKNFKMFFIYFFNNINEFGSDIRGSYEYIISQCIISKG